MRSADKPLVWLEGEIRTPPFSPDGRLEAGQLLRRLQRGEMLGMPHSRPMPSVGSRCHELRVNDAGATWRIIYRIDSDAIVILKVYSKRAEKLHDQLSTHVNEESGNTIMRKRKKRHLEAKGWRVGTVQDFLGLSEEESAYIEVKIRLAEGLRQRRQAKRLSQADLATKLQSSQSRVAKMEAGDPSVSLDLLIRSLIRLGASHHELSRIIATRSAA
jgi:phage-related protein